MGKISPVSSKYIISASIEIEGVVDKPDVIGAIFGQTEGLLGSELELRELQRSGRIGRIEVNVDTRGGKSTGTIIIPSSLDKAETAIVGASLEIIQRIGPCNAKIKVSNIEDVRISKRSMVVERAKELLKKLMEQVMPDSQEITDEVAQAVRTMEVVEYGRDRVPAGPGIDESEELIIVEGRADVVCLLKNGFKNVIALNGTACPPTVVELSKKKETVLFVDGDRGGNLIIKEITSVADIDFITRAPDGKEVEELTKKEIHKAIRSKITLEQAKHELSLVDTSNSIRKPMIMRPLPQMQVAKVPIVAPPVVQKTEIMEIKEFERKKFSELLESLIGTRGAIILDEKMNNVGKVPFSELAATIKGLTAPIHALIMDGIIDRDLISAAEKNNTKFVVGMDSKVKQPETRVRIVTATDL